MVAASKPAGKKKRNGRGVTVWFEPSLVRRIDATGESYRSDAIKGLIELGLQQFEEKHVPLPKPKRKRRARPVEISEEEEDIS